MNDSKKELSSTTDLYTVKSIAETAVNDKTNKIKEINITLKSIVASVLSTMNRWDCYEIIFMNIKRLIWIYKLDYNFVISYLCLIN